MEENKSFDISVSSENSLLEAENRINSNESKGILSFYTKIFIVCCCAITIGLATTQTNVLSRSKIDTTVASAKKPNIIFIVADDLGWNSLGKSYNEAVIDAITTNLTSIVADGIYMTNYYAQEVCTPSRASMLTGRYPLSVGMQYDLIDTEDQWGLDLSETTIADVFKGEGYSTYMLGKWHLGHHSPDYLPTARGFDRYIGYLSGQGYYWSKKTTEFRKYQDFMTADTTCYRGYNGRDLHEYSTFFYTNHAIDIIDNHIDSDVPFFLYLSYQAVHDPYYDVELQYSNGLPDSFIPDDILSIIHKSTQSNLHKEYLKSLYLLDKGIGKVYSHLLDNNLMENTYIVFASDNGGCYASGGFNGPLRGTKGSLFEGGIRVDSFISSPLLSETGINYNGLFHVSDWFPTILSLAGISYKASKELSLDGVDHSDAFFDKSLKPREHMLHNLYAEVDNYFFDIWTNGSFAIRNTQYKLMHTFNSTIYAKEYSLDYKDLTAITDDGHCSQVVSNANGPFTVSQNVMLTTFVDKFLLHSIIYLIS